jgi:hypothetical protein
MDLCGFFIRGLDSTIDVTIEADDITKELKSARVTRTGAPDLRLRITVVAHVEIIRPIVANMVLPSGLFANDSTSWQIALES